MLIQRNVSVQLQFYDPTNIKGWDSGRLLDIVFEIPTELRFLTSFGGSLTFTASILYKSNWSESLFPCFAEPFFI